MTANHIRPHNQRGLGVYGVEIAVDPPDAVCDIVFVHGLRGGQYSTWSDTSEKAKNPICWPCDILPKYVPKARIIMYGYDADIAKISGPSSQNAIGGHAQDFLSSLAGRRFMTGTMLVLSDKSGLEHEEKVWKATKEVLFFGTPHAGSDLEKWAQYVRSLSRLIGKGKSPLLGVLNRNSEVLAILQKDFHTLLRKSARNGHEVQLYMFYEELPYLGTTKIVDDASAKCYGHPDTGIRRDHQGLTKYSSEDDPDLRDKILPTLILKIQVISASLQISRPPNLDLQQPRSLTSEASSSNLAAIGNSNGESSFAIFQANPRQTHRQLILEPGGNLPDRIIKAIMNSRTRDPPRSNTEPGVVGTAGRLAQLKALMQSFHFPDYITPNKERLDTICKSTCEWILENKSFQKFQETHKSILWITGAPGQGKTVLAAYIARHFGYSTDKREADVKDFVLYIQCDDQINSKYRPIISNLIHQLLRSDASLIEKVEIFTDMHEQVHSHRLANTNRKAVDSKADRIYLWKLLLYLIEISGKNRIYAIVDGLDQCIPETQNAFIEILAKWGCTEKLHLVVTSRPYERLRISFADITKQAADFKQLDLHKQRKHVRKDIETFTTNGVEQLAELRKYGPRTKILLLEYLLADRSGLFLPVKLILLRLRHVPGTDMEKVLRRIATGETMELDALYKVLFDEITSNPDLDLQPINFLLHAFRPLTVVELAWACKKPQMEFTISSSSSSSSNRSPFLAPTDEFKEILRLFRSDLQFYLPLIRVGQGKLVEFIHPTTEEYLLRQSRIAAASSKLLPPIAFHKTIALDCMNYILMMSGQINLATTFGSASDLQNRHRILCHCPLLEYSFTYWHHHLAKALQGKTKLSEVPPDIISTVRTLDRRRQSTQRADSFWAGVGEFCGYFKATPKFSELTSIELFCLLGLAPFAIDAIEHENVGSIALPLTLAIRRGSAETVETLIDTSNFRRLDKHELSEIIDNANRCGNTMVFRELNQKIKISARDIASSLHTAFSNADSDLRDAIVEVTGNVTRRDNAGMTALHQLFFASSTERSMALPYQLEAYRVYAIILFLVAYNADLHARDDLGNNLLHHICSNRKYARLSLVRNVIGLGVNPLERNHLGRLPLHNALHTGLEPAVIEHLLYLSGSAAVGEESNCGSKPLHLAMQGMSPYFGSDSIFEESVSLVRLLLLHGADPVARNSHGKAPMDYCTKGREVFQMVYLRLDGIEHINVLHPGKEHLQLTDEFYYKRITSRDEDISRKIASGEMEDTPEADFHDYGDSWERYWSSRPSVDPQSLVLVPPRYQRTNSQVYEPEDETDAEEEMYFSGSDCYICNRYEREPGQPSIEYTCEECGRHASSSRQNLGLLRSPPLNAESSEIGLGATSLSNEESLLGGSVSLSVMNGRENISQSGSSESLENTTASPEPRGSNSGKEGSETISEALTSPATQLAMVESPNAIYPVGNATENRTDPMTGSDSRSNAVPIITIEAPGTQTAQVELTVPTEHQDLPPADRQTLGEQYEKPTPGLSIPENRSQKSIPVDGVAEHSRNVRKLKKSRSCQEFVRHFEKTISVIFGR
ncbi:hypothetical protein H072_2926 [Dactylellina haptotyla CBS 200.50]|uniref:Nephrocystin 3-like N-terminal domain-containing protein n=1 Tax=Dactylellina haptotyla (strain CBS 200.50) TaxID=1284197 RepID=S8APY5_DACHA|nr:hypothetical protein H072_2926 [Dactylellina haptotyla CBS 200.50]